MEAAAEKSRSATVLDLQDVMCVCVCVGVCVCVCVCVRACVKEKKDNEGTNQDKFPTSRQNRQ